MKKWIFITVAMCVIPLLFNCNRIADRSPMKVTSGNLYRLEIFSPEMNETINVDVWTPNGYSRETKLPVIYMHDGQNLFDASATWNKQSWEMDSTAGAMISKGEIPPVIIAGIHSTDTTRIGDLMPEKPLQYLTDDTVKTFIDMMCRGKYRADEYLAFIVNTLKPQVDSLFSTDTSCEATFVMGSSMGGLISIYAMSEYPETFGGAGCLSTHWSGTIERNNDFPSAMRRYLTEKLPQSCNHRLYMDNGDRTIDSVYIPYFHAMNALADSLGYHEGDRLLTGFHPGEAHDERAWAKRVAIPLRFLLQKYNNINFTNIKNNNR